MKMDMWKSKKFRAAAAATAVAALAKGLSYLGVAITTEELTTILAPLMLYIVGQGIADHGKERFKAEQELKEAQTKAGTQQ